MSDEEKPSTDDLENLPDPDTDTGEGKFPAMEAIPVAEPEGPRPGAPGAPPASPEGPRVFPQQYTMLFANTCILVAALTVWERGFVTGKPDLYGFQSIGGSFVMAAAAYCVLVGIVGLIRGGMRLGSSLLSSFFALYFAISSMLRVSRLDGFKTYGDLKDELNSTVNAMKTFLPQFGPGQYMCLFGGAVIIWMFIKAMFFSKKKAPEPAPRRRR